MFFIASHFQLPPVSERFHGNYRQTQQSGSHRSDHKVTPADSLHLQPASSRSGNTCLPQRPEFWSFAVYRLLRVTQVSCFSLDSCFSSICSVCVCFDCQWLHTPFRQRPDYQHTTPSVWASPELHTVTIGNTGYTGITGNLLSCNRLPASPRSWRFITDQTNLSSVS